MKIRIAPTRTERRLWQRALVAMVLLLSLYALSVAAFLRGGLLVQADYRIADLMHSAQTPLGLRIAAHVTALGDWRVTSLLTAAAFVALWLSGRPALSIGLVVATAGQATAVPLLKDLFDRSRPVYAHFSEASQSFPSGHAAVSAALFGFVGYALWRSGALRAGLVLPATAAVILSVGFSRIYLAEHYLGDVVNGYLVGGFFLLIGVVASDVLQTVFKAQARGRKKLAVLSALPFVALAGAVIVTYDKALTVPETMKTSAAVPSVGTITKNDGG